MGLACSQIRLLTLTQRKGDVELGISLDSIEKMALTREQSQLSSEYYSKLQAKKIEYYANGKYEKMSYEYLMGHGANYDPILNGSEAMKNDNNMILADYRGQVVLKDCYAQAITSVLGAGAMDAEGRGKNFSQDKIPEIMAALIPGISSDDFRTVINNETVESYKSPTTPVNTKNPEEKGSTYDKDYSQQSNIEKIVDFYLPILKAAASNGWTTEYNKNMDFKVNPDYVSDALVTGTFQLEHVNNYGNYDEGTSLTYFITSGKVVSRTDSDTREEITAWYNAEKGRIEEKENYIDMHMSDLSTELEAINTEIQSIQSYIDDAIQSVFDWGAG